MPLEGWCRPGVAPPLQLAVAVRKRERSSVVVVGTGEIDDSVLLPVIVEASHVDEEAAIVNAIFALIDKDPCLTGTGIGHIALFEINEPSGRIRWSPWTRSAPSVAPHPIIDGETTKARPLLSARVDAHASIARTPPYSEG